MERSRNSENDLAFRSTLAYGNEQARIEAVAYRDYLRDLPSNVKEKRGRAERYISGLEDSNTVTSCVIIDFEPWDVIISRGKRGNIV
jgi:hypothetical protein